MVGHTDIPIPKGRDRREGRREWSWASPNPTRQATCDLKTWEQPTGAGVLPLQLYGTGVQHPMFWDALPYRCSGHWRSLQWPCPCSGSLPDSLLLTGVWSSDSPRGWGSEPVALPGVLRNLGEGSQAPRVPVLSVWAQTVLQGSCQSLHLVPPRGVPTKAQLHQGLNYLRDEGLLSFTFLSWLSWANAHLTTFIVFSP